MTSYPRELGSSFADPEVVRNYRYRPPYPAEVFDVLERLLVAPRTVLDAGCGTGALTRGLARFAERIDAVDPSNEMIAEAKRLASSDRRINWTVSRAEDAPLLPPYGLITTGASVHWMDTEVVMSRFRDALAEGASVAIVDAEWIHPDHPWRDEFVDLIKRYSALKHHDDFAGVVRSLESTGHFTRTGSYRVPPIAFQQSSDEYLAMLASTSSLSRASLGSARDDFEREARRIFARHRIERVRYDVAAAVVWGQPS
jgi:SAM-dependent methyltransferase